MPSRTALKVDGVSVGLQFIEPKRVLAKVRNFKPIEQKTTLATVQYDLVDVIASDPKFGDGNWEKTVTISGFDL